MQRGRRTGVSHPRARGCTAGLAADTHNLGVSSALARMDGGSGSVARAPLHMFAPTVTSDSFPSRKLPSFSHSPQVARPGRTLHASQRQFSLSFRRVSPACARMDRPNANRECAPTRLARVCADGPVLEEAARLLWQSRPRVRGWTALPALGARGARRLARVCADGPAWLR